MKTATRLKKALLKIRAVACGEDQVADDDTEGLRWIVNFIDSEVVLGKPNRKKAKP